MADCDVVTAHEDLMHQQSYDSLTLCHFQDISSGAQSCAELGEGFPPGASMERETSQSPPMGTEDETMLPRV
jgi:hypothetical protein